MKRLALCLLAGCAGEVVSTPGTPGAPDAPAPRKCGAADLPPTRIARLSHEQYVKTLESLLGNAGAVDIKKLPPPEEDFVAPGKREPVAAPLAEQYLAVAETAAAAVPLAQILPCRPADPANAPCVQKLAADFGRLAWRRPLETAEMDSLGTVYRTVAGTLGAEAGVRAVLQAVLLSPHLLYRTELGRPVAGDPTRVALGAHELASALSYLIGNRPPPPALSALADDGSLLEPGRLATEARRLMSGDGPAAPVLWAFFERWLGVRGVGQVEKDQQMFPAWSPALMAALGEETRLFVNDILWKGDGSVKTMLTARHTFATRDTAKVYKEGISASGPTFGKVDLNPAQRLGLLTHPSVLAAHAQPTATGVVERGRFLAEAVLCIEVQEPPPNLPPFKEPNPSATGREVWQEHSANPACAGCHRLFDGLGLAFENYDPLGAFRTVEKGKSIDASAEVLLSPARPPVRVAGALDLIQRMTSSPEVYQCFARQYFRYAFGRSETSSDACTLAGLDHQFRAGAYDVKALVTAVVSSDAFRFRNNGR